MAVDPLELLKAANNPALTQTNVNAQKTANDLTAGLAKLNSQRAGQLNLANINNAGAADRTAMGLGFTGAPELRNSSPELTIKRGLDNALTGSNTNLNNSGAALNRAKFGVYPDPPPGSPAQTVQDIKTLTKPGISVGERTAAAGNVSEASQETGETTKSARLNEGGILEEVTTVNSNKQKGTSKNSAIAAQRSKRIQDSVAAKFKEIERPFKSIEILSQNDSEAVISVDGGPAETVKIRSVPRKSGE